jgi:hypothetical protein
MDFQAKTVKDPVIFFLRCCSMIGLIYFFVEAKKSETSEPDIFIGTTPCDQSVRPMLSIPANSDCEMITWQLSLFKDPNSLAPSGFDLKYTYGMSKAGTQGFINDGTTVSSQGKWSSLQNTGGLPAQSIIKLHSTEMQPVSFVKMDKNLVHLLDDEGKLMIGNAGWSYTLNRAKN